MLLPDGGWVITGDQYKGIQFLDCDPITKKEFEDGLAQYDSIKAEQAAVKAKAKSALLERLGITEDEAKLLLA